MNMERITKFYWHGDLAEVKASFDAWITIDNKIELCRVYNTVEFANLPDGMSYCNHLTVAIPYGRERLFIVREPFVEGKSEWIEYEGEEIYPYTDRSYLEHEIWQCKMDMQVIPVQFEMFQKPAILRGDSSLTIEFMEANMHERVKEAEAKLLKLEKEWRNKYGNT